MARRRARRSKRRELSQAPAFYAVGIVLAIGIALAGNAPAFKTSSTGAFVARGASLVCDTPPWVTDIAVPCTRAGSTCKAWEDNVLREYQCVASACGNAHIDATLGEQCETAQDCTAQFGQPGPGTSYACYSCQCYSV